VTSCSWKQARGLVAFDEAQHPPRLIGQSVAGPITWLEVTIRAGSAHDPIGQEGLAWLTAQLMREGGAGDRDAEAIAAALFELGTDISVLVDREMVSFRVRCLTDDLPMVAEILGDILTQPKLSEDVAARLRAESAQWLTEGLANSDERLGFAMLDNWLFTGHRYAHPPRGRAGVVDTLTLASIETFIAERYIRPATVLGVAGSMIDEAGNLIEDAPGAAEIMKLQSRLEATMPARLYKDVTPRVVEPIAGRKLLVVGKPTQATGIHFGHLTALRRDHPDWAAMTLALATLGEHRQSHGRLYKALRTARGLNYGDYAYPEMYRPAGGSRDQQTATGRVQNPFVVWLRPTTVENGPFALKAAIGLVEHFVVEGLPEEEFEKMSADLRARIALRAASPGRRLGWHGETDLSGWPNSAGASPC